MPIQKLLGILKSKIKKNYEKHSNKRVCQGDIFRDFDFNIVDEKKDVFKIFYKYIVVISQDCDLKFGAKKSKKVISNEEKTENQYLPNILFTPAFTETQIREGIHLKDIYNIVQTRKNSSQWTEIKNNNNDRYHYLPSFSDYQIPELIIDFKNYYSLSPYFFFKKFGSSYLSTVNELFREKLSQRFSNYLCRIGTPVIRESESN